MSLSSDPSIENLKELIDKYEHPELFSFLDDMQFQIDFSHDNKRKDIHKNMLLTLKTDDGEETGIVTGVSAEKIAVNFYGEDRKFELADSSLVRSDTRTLPLEWAIRNKWDELPRFRLKTLAYYLYLAHTFDKMQSLSNSRTQILAHQIESTYRVVTSITPRFLMADEVGLGKTIEAGLIIKEFMIRHGYNRVLIIVPASLQFQWQQEMREKFNEDFTIIDGRAYGKMKSGFPQKVIMSLDFAKQEKVKKKLVREQWDTIVFDEAHRLRRDSRISTKAYHLADEISGRCKVFLLLSATPFSGKLEELFYLVKLLNPNLLGTLHNFTMDYIIGKREDLKDKIAPVVIRRRKIDVGGFTRRFAKTIPFEFTSEERELYDRTTEYIRTEYNKALAAKNKFHAFILIVYQKMLDSSSITLLHTVTKRIDFIEACLENRELLQKEIGRKKEVLILLEEAKDDEELCEAIVEEHGLLVEEDMKTELSALKIIHSLAMKIKKNKKSEKLAEIIKEAVSKNPKEKIIIFTQFFRTLQYLKNELKEYSMSLFHGGLSKEEKDKAVQEFKDKNTLFISTEAGGEGRNLQFARTLVNYDLPWSPLKIEQRIGRIHRFGQKYDVRIFNFSTKDTIGEKVLDILVHKIKVFDDSFGGSDTLLGYIEDEVDFNKTFMDFHLDVHAAEKEISDKIETARKNFHYLEELTAHKVVDFNLDAFYQSTHKERAASNRLIEEMLSDYAEISPDRLVLEKGMDAKDKDPFWRVIEKNIGRRTEGYFDSTLALKRPDRDFFAFGHKLVDAVSAEAREPSFFGLTSRVILDLPSATRCMDGVLFNFVVDLRSAKLYQNLIPVFVDRNTEVDFSDEEMITTEFLKFNFKDGSNEFFPAFGREQYTALFNKALLFLEFKIKGMLDRIRADLEMQIGKEIPAINKHYNRILQELEEILALQKNKEKIYNVSTLKGLITRTENKIKQFKTQKEREMERMRNIREIRTSYKLLNCALIKVNGTAK